MSFMQLASCLTAEVQIGKWVVYVVRATVTLCFWTNVKKGKSLVTRFYEQLGGFGSSVTTLARRIQDDVDWVNCFIPDSRSALI